MEYIGHKRTLFQLNFNTFHASEKGNRRTRLRLITGFRQNILRRHKREHYCSSNAGRFRFEPLGSKNVWPINWCGHFIYVGSKLVACVYPTSWELNIKKRHAFVYAPLRPSGIFRFQHGECWRLPRRMRILPFDGFCFRHPIADLRCNGIRWTNACLNARWCVACNFIRVGSAVLFEASHRTADVRIMIMVR